MNSCELVTYISSLACLISQSCTKEEVAVLATVFTQLGDTLSTILAHDEIKNGFRSQQGHMLTLPVKLL